MKESIRTYIDKFNNISLPDYVCQLVLFGSHAYGTPNLLSDIDIAVVSKRPLKILERVLVEEEIEGANPPGELQLTFVVKDENTKYDGFDVKKDIFERGVLFYENQNISPNSSRGL